MSLQTDLSFMDFSSSCRVNAIDAIAKIRQEWEEIAEGKSLLNLEAPIGLFLADVADRLELTPQERLVLLGEMLIEEIEDFMKQQVRPLDQ